MLQHKTNLIIDSGAYSAWRQGKPVVLSEYCAWLKANADWVDHYVALDMINPGDSEVAAAQSFKNLEYMLAEGLHPIPVYHTGEDVKWLHRMLDVGCTYIGLSASSLVSRNKVDDWYAFAWSHLVTASGEPVVRAHAFGEGRRISLVRFPWYSADSASWIYMAQVTGQMYMPDGRRVAQRNDQLDSKTTPDVRNLMPHDMAEFEAVLRRNRIKPDGIRDDPKGAAIRSILTANYFLETQVVMRNLQPKRFIPSGFFAPRGSKRPAIDLGAFNMHLAAASDPYAYTSLAYLNHPNMLFSYFYMKESAQALLRSFSEDRLRTCQTIPSLLKSWNIVKECTYEE